MMETHLMDQRRSCQHGYKIGYKSLFFIAVGEEERRLVDVLASLQVITGQNQVLRGELGL